MKIYCDMDGVLCNFMGTVQKVDPTLSDESPDDKLWPVVRAIPDFWENLPWMPGAKDLWDFIKPHKPIILSSPSRQDVRSPSGKLIWIHRELHYDQHFFFTRASLKCYLAAPDAVLIDDFESNIKGWRKNGGIGIHHKDPIATIQELQKLLSNG